MKKQTLTKKQQKALLDIAKRLMVEVESRGDLEARGCDSEDFIEVPVWGIQNFRAYIDCKISTKVCEDKEKSPSRAQLGEKEGGPKVIFPVSDLARLLKPDRYCNIADWAQIVNRVFYAEAESVGLRVSSKTLRR